MRLTLHGFVCASSHRFDAAISSPLIYGDAHARSSKNPDPAFLSLLECDEYIEMMGILENLESYRAADEHSRCAVRNRVFGYVADPSVDGTRFVLFGSPSCPICSSSETWLVGTPLAAYDGDVQKISFDSWRTLSKEARERCVRHATTVSS